MLHRLRVEETVSILQVRIRHRRWVDREAEGII